MYTDVTKLYFIWVLSFKNIQLQTFCLLGKVLIKYPISFIFSIMPTIKNIRSASFMYFFSVGETLHVAYKKYKIKRKFTFFTSHELKTSEFSLVLRTRENLMFLTRSMKYIGIHLQKVNIICILRDELS